MKKCVLSSITTLLRMTTQIHTRLVYNLGMLCRVCYTLRPWRRLHLCVASRVANANALDWISTTTTSFTSKVTR